MRSVLNVPAADISNLLLLWMIWCLFSLAFSLHVLSLDVNFHQFCFDHENDFTTLVLNLWLVWQAADHLLIVSSSI